MRARGRYGVGEPAGAGASVESTNSGDASLDMCVRKRGRHGAGPMLDGVMAVVDMVRARRERRWGAREEAIVVVNFDSILLMDVGALRLNS